MIGFLIYELTGKQSHEVTGKQSLEGKPKAEGNG